MPGKKTPEEKSKKNYRDACERGYCPSLAERENNRIIELANRLKSTSDKETLTNVLEWQNRNIVFWFERYPLSLTIWSLVLAILATSSLFILSPSIWFWCFVVLVSVFVTLSSIAIYMIRSYRKLPLKQVFNIFPRNISIDSILDNKLCVCRDYAKLTASLLFNIYPEREIFFVHAPSHVATAIKVENRFYVLDKYLPVVTIDKWHNLWHKRRFSTKKVEKVKGTSLETVDLKSVLIQTSSLKPDTDRLTNEMKRRLSIQSSADNSRKGSWTALHWKNGAVLYDDDEIVNHSLARRLKMMITNQMIDMNRITNLEIEQKKNDLILRVKLPHDCDAVALNPTRL